MFESTAVLCSETQTLDESLNVVSTYSDRTVYVKPRSVYGSDFYEAARSGLQPSVVLELAAPAEYQGERLVVYNGRKYTVIRVYQRPDRDTVELTLEERMKNGG